MRRIVLAFSLAFCGVFMTNARAETQPPTAASLSLDLGSEVFDEESLMAENSFVAIHEEGLMRNEEGDRFDADSEKVVIAPEPSSLIAFMFGLSALMMRWDRRRSQAEARRSKLG